MVYDFCTPGTVDIYNSNCILQQMLATWLATEVFWHDSMYIDIYSAQEHLQPREIFI